MLSVVIPMYNEEKYVLKTVNTLVPYLNGLQIGYEIIFSDDLYVYLLTAGRG